MAEHYGFATVLHNTSFTTSSDTSATFADDKKAIGTAVSCLLTGSAGTFEVQRQMKKSGAWVAVEAAPLALVAGELYTVTYDFPLGVCRVKVNATVPASSVTAEVEVRSKGRM
jgi:hypothetical protein